MTQDSNWFESPFPRAISYLHQNPLRHEADHEQEQQAQYRLQGIAPMLIPPTPKGNAVDRDSPWSKFINSEHDQRMNQIVISGLIPEQNQHQKSINQKLFYSGDEEEELMTPLEQCKSEEEQQDKGQLHTTGKKSQFENTAKKSRPREKGLRKLSQRAYEIVLELKNATYKEVAAQLVQELNEEELESQNKEEQNIKRRVYDALNVLIALGVLKKDGRRIVSQRSSSKGYNTALGRVQELQALKKKMEAKQKKIQAKRQALEQAQDKLLAIAAVFKRNKGLGLHQAGIPFPFIGIILPENNFDKARLEHNQQFIMTSSEPLQPFGDIDSLKWLKDSFERLELNQKEKA